MNISSLLSLHQKKFSLVNKIIDNVFIIAYAINISGLLTLGYLDIYHHGKLSNILIDTTIPDTAKWTLILGVFTTPLILIDCISQKRYKLMFIVFAIFLHYIFILF